MCVCACVCAPLSLGHLVSLTLSLLLPLGHHTSGFQIRLQGSSSQPFPQHLCDMGQDAQTLCVSILVCDTGWEHQRFGLLHKHKQNLAEDG